MKIAILNEVFLSQKQIDELRTLGELVIHPNTRTEEEAIERLKGVDVALIDSIICPLNKAILESTDQLKFIALNTIGYDTVDLDAANKKNIKVSNLPGYSTQAVAEQVFALAFAVARKIALGDRKMREGPFEIDPNEKLHNQFVGTELFNKTIGIVGLGRIGTRVAEIAHNLGMKVLAHNRTPKDIPNIKFVSFEELLQNSDIVTIHLSLSAETKHYFGVEQFKRMKTESIFINVARGNLVDEEALIDALKSGEISGAGLDVISSLDKNNELLSLENTVLTPHSAFFTGEALENLATMIVDNVKAFVSGSPINLVNGS